MNTEGTGQTPWYSRKGLFLLVGAIILIVSVFGYRTTQLRLDMATQAYEAVGEGLVEVAYLICPLALTDDAIDPGGWRWHCLQLQAERQDYALYNSLSFAGVALGLILVVYGVIPKRQSG